MAEKGFKRKLTAILSADAVEYSRLMGEDEEATVRKLKAYRDILYTLIQQHNGQVLDSPGDNLLAEFVSVVDAVQCAVAVQKEIKARNDELPENRRMQFRIGINLGDVIQEEGRIYGDGVNIAARLEGLAEPGGICISKTAFDHIESKLPYGYDFIGDQTVKNIAKPVGAYRVLMDPRVTVSGKSVDAKTAGKRPRLILNGVAAGLFLAVAVVIWQFYTHSTPPPVEPASIEKMAFPLPEKPSIAVLPFENLSGDPDQVYIADGITENIITGLSKIPQMFVVARNSVFTYKGKPIKIRQISEALGVRYVLEGSVQKEKEGGRVRITAQLVDALEGHHLWAERYDRELKDLFALQDEITMKILTALEIKLTEGVQALVYHHTTENLDAYTKVLKGREYIYSHKPEDLILARQVLREAVALDPEYLVAWRYLAVSYLMEIWIGASESPAKSIERAEALAQKILSLDDTDAEAYFTLGQIYLLKSQHEESAAAFQKTIAINPNHADAYAILSAPLWYMRKFEEALESMNKAMRLNPTPPIWYYGSQGECYRGLGRYEEAIEVCKKALHLHPEHPTNLTNLVLAYSAMGRENDARASAAELLRIKPDFLVEPFVKSLPYKYEDDRKRDMELLWKAGLK